MVDVSRSFLSLPIKLCRCFPWLSTWNRNLLSRALFSMSTMGLEGHEANEIPAPLGMKNRNSVVSRPSCGEPLLKFCFQKRKGAFLCLPLLKFPGRFCEINKKKNYNHNHAFYQVGAVSVLSLPRDITPFSSPSL